MARAIFWIAIVLVLLAALGAGSRNYYAPSPGVTASAATIVPDLPSQHLAIAKASWRKEGFGQVAFATFSIKNNGNLPAKDIEIGCDFFGKSGTKISSGSATIYDVVPAARTKSFPEVSLGFIDKQSASMSCSIAGAD